jgi:ketosteroid isomerase-like protein
MAKSNSLLLVATLLSACARVPGYCAIASECPGQGPSIPVAEAERNFAADAVKRTVQEAFLTAFAKDAIMFRPTPVNAHQALTSRPIPANADLRWTPTQTETASAGDLAVSTGPSERGVRGQPLTGTGYFLSVWRANGNKWEVVFDAGNSGPIPVTVAQASGMLSRRTLRPSPTRSDDIEQMRNDVLNVEGKLIEDYGTLLRNYGASDLRLYRDEHTPTATIGDAVGLVRNEDDVEWTPQQAFVSKSGDLAYVYGIAKVGDKEGGYIRVWRNQDGNWKVAYDLR